MSASPDETFARTVRLLEMLVGFDTESALSNLPLIDFVEAYLRDLGVPVERVPNAAGDKAAIHALIGPPVDGGIVLSGHTDCVPVTGQAWTSDPFTLRRDGDKVFGRGTCDMKGFDACCLASVPMLLAAGLKRPIHLVLSYDEEVSCAGSLDVIGRFGIDLPRPAACIVGEPTLMRVADGQKSVATYLTHVRGHEAHSAKPMLGVSAIAVAVDLVAAINRIGETFRTGVPDGSRFDPPCATVHVGAIAGGTARNILARDCRFHWEYRGLPEMPIRAAYDLFEAAAQTHRETTFRDFPDCFIETLIECEVPGLVPEPGSAAEQLALALTGHNATDAVSYATEAGQFQKAGIATVICGPGSIDQAHQRDEFIADSELHACLRFLRDLATRLT